ncbi:hypothetical protein [Halegenticoccus soli]|uniref:hypothetical protein n=1 Tax=Halegenticoccus soli TaxID=1985678 RepID=UPI000C6CB26D|nr:hypothetical protein [Halegenticoccus soli]
MELSGKNQVAGLALLIVGVALVAGLVVLEGTPGLIAAVLGVAALSIGTVLIGLSRGSRPV